MFIFLFHHSLSFWNGTFWDATSETSAQMCLFSFPPCFSCLCYLFIYLLIYSFVYLFIATKGAPPSVVVTFVTERQASKLPAFQFALEMIDRVKKSNSLLEEDPEGRSDRFDRSIHICIPQRQVYLCYYNAQSVSISSVPS